MTYCRCGQLLLLSIADITVRLPSGEDVPFQRRTDFVLCDRCLSRLPVSVLRESEEVGAGQGPQG